MDFFFNKLSNESDSINSRLSTLLLIQVFRSLTFRAEIFLTCIRSCIYYLYSCSNEIVHLLKNVKLQNFIQP